MKGQWADKVLHRNFDPLCSVKSIEIDCYKPQYNIEG